MLISTDITDDDDDDDDDDTFTCSCTFLIGCFCIVLNCFAVVILMLLSDTTEKPGERESKALL